MIPATPPLPRLRLVHDDADPLPDVAAELDQLRRERDAAREELAELRRRADRLECELRLAGRVQRDFLPKRLPAVGDAHFATLFRPASHVSGDLYDVVRLDEHHVGFYVADAVGHGVPAALLTMFIKHALPTKQIFGGGYRLIPPSETLARLNEALVQQGLSADTFATAVYGVVDVRTRGVTLSRAGHPNPLRLSAAAAPVPVDCDGGLLGMSTDEPFTEAAFTLAPGERLLLYTDGVEVAFAADPLDSLCRWRDLLAAPADRFLADTAAAVDRFNVGGPPRDDLTLLVLDVG